MNKALSLTLLLAGLSISSVGLTAGGGAHREGGVYFGVVGGGAGYYAINNDDFLDSDDNLNTNSGAWQGFAGIESDRFLALEGAYTDFGTATDGEISTELSALSAAVLLHLPLGRNMAPYGKAGVTSWDRTRSLGSLSAEDKGVDVFLGLGARFSMTPTVDTRIEYERFDFDDATIDMISGKIQFRF